MNEVFSTTGGYMQFISAVMALIALLTKKFSLEQKLLNSLFNFNIKQKKIILFIEYKKKLDYNTSIEKGNVKDNSFILYEPKKSIVSRRSKRDSILILNRTTNNNLAKLRRSVTYQKISSKRLNDLKSKDSSSKSGSNSIFQKLKKENEQNINIMNEPVDPNINRSKMNMIVKEDDLNLNENMSIKKSKKRKSNFDVMSDLQMFDQGRRSTVHFNIFDYYCFKRINNKKTEIDLFNFGINFFKSQLDVINFFNIIILTQIMLTQQSDKKQNFLSRKIELAMK